MTKDITNILNAYEKFILAAVNFQKLNNNQDDFKDYLYTKQDYDSKKHANDLFIAALYKPEILRKDTEKLINEVIKTSGLEQTDPKLRDNFKKLVDSWKFLQAEVKKIPESDRAELAKQLKNAEKIKDTMDEPAEDKQISEDINTSDRDYYDSPEELFDNGDARATLLDGYIKPMLEDNSIDTVIKNEARRIKDSVVLQDELINLIKAHLNESESLYNLINDFDAYELGDMDSPWNLVIDIANDTIEDFIKTRLIEPSTISDEFTEYDNLWD